MTACRFLESRARLSHRATRSPIPFSHVVVTRMCFDWRRAIQLNCDFPWKFSRFVGAQSITRRCATKSLDHSQNSWPHGSVSVAKNIAVERGRNFLRIGISENWKLEIKHQKVVGSRFDRKHGDFHCQESNSKREVIFSTVSTARESVLCNPSRAEFQLCKSLANFSFL